MEKRKDRQKEKYDETYWGTVENMKMTTRPDPKYKASIASCRVIQNRIQERQIEKKSELSDMLYTSMPFYVCKCIQSLHIHKMPAF